MKTDLSGDGDFDDTGAAGDRVETREHNEINQITERTLEEDPVHGYQPSLPFAYDDAGNMRESTLDGGSNPTQAGWNFTLFDGKNTYVADLNNPDFFNLGDINTWDTSNLWDQWHLQGSFANSNPLDLTFDDLTLTPNGTVNCLRMQVSVLTAGEYALWEVGDATPGEQIVIVCGTQPGQTNVKGTGGFCADFGIKGITQKSVICRRVADNAGTVLRTQLLPPGVQGLRLLTQAAMSGTCPDPCTSNLDDQIVQ